MSLPSLIAALSPYYSFGPVSGVQLSYDTLVTGPSVIRLQSFFYLAPVIRWNGVLSSNGFQGPEPSSCKVLNFPQQKLNRWLTYSGY